MDTTDPTAATFNGATECTAPKIEHRRPPITLLGHENISKISKELNKIIKSDLKIVNTRKVYATIPPR